MWLLRYHCWNEWIVSSLFFLYITLFSTESPKRKSNWLSVGPISAPWMYWGSRNREWTEQISGSFSTRQNTWINHVTDTEHSFREKTPTGKAGITENENFPLSEENRYLLRCYSKVVKYNFVQSHLILIVSLWRYLYPQRDQDYQKDSVICAVPSKYEMAPFGLEPSSASFIPCPTCLFWQGQGSSWRLSSGNKDPVNRQETVRKFGCR